MSGPFSNISPGWKPLRLSLGVPGGRTLSRARADIQDLLQSSPSLRPTLETAVAEQLPRALKLAASALARHSETPCVPLDGLRYDVNQVVNDWFPQL